MSFRSRIVNKITLALLATAGLAGAQRLTISARPGLVNYIEGQAFLNGNPWLAGTTAPQYLNANDSFATRKGKAEILLMPGTFLRIGDNSSIQMISPSLIAPRFELQQGEASLEGGGLIRGSHIEVVDQNALILIEKDGLYRMTAGVASTVAVIEGSAQVTLLDQTIKLSKGRQTVLLGTLESTKFDLAQDDDLYAWSSVRSQYEAVASYDAAGRLAAADQFTTVGWYFNSFAGCWAWLPIGRCFSPFGWGFYSPLRVGGATVVRCPVFRGGRWQN